jgi:hypothetical protein
MHTLTEDDMWNDRTVGEREIFAIEVKDINLANVPTANFAWYVGGIAIPKNVANHYIIGAARFFEELSDRACGEIRRSDTERDRISEELGYEFYWMNEFIDGLHIWIKAQGTGAKLTIANESLGVIVSAPIPCVVFQTVAAELSKLANDSLAESIRRRA